MYYYCFTMLWVYGVPLSTIFALTIIKFVNFNITIFIFSTMSETTHLSYQALSIVLSHFLNQGSKISWNVKVFEHLRPKTKHQIISNRVKYFQTHHVDDHEIHLYKEILSNQLENDFTDSTANTDILHSIDHDLPQNRNICFAKFINGISSTIVYHVL